MQNTTKTESRIERNERLRDFMPSNDKIKSLFKIRNKRGQQVSYKPNRSQAWYRSKRTRRNLILKGRQQGMSKEIDADQLADCLKKSTNAVVVSHEKEATKRLFSAVKYFVDHMDVKPATSTDSKSEIKFPKMGSSYFIGTAGQRAFGRGDTVDRAHLSEAAFYPNLELILAGIAEAAEYGEIDIETTPNGRDKFYDMWKKAKEGKSPWTPIFIPWFMNEEYDVNMMTEQERQGLSVGVQEMFAVPDDEYIVSEDEQKLIEYAKRDFDIDITIGQLKWRKYKIWDKGELFYQEYPEDDESCFLQAGRSVFKFITVDERLKIPLDDLSKMKKEDLERLHKQTAKKAGNKIKMLYGGIDPAEGNEGGDRHSFTVIEANSPNHKDNGAVVIYEYTSDEPIDVFADKVGKICKEFEICLGIEKNGVGTAMVRAFKQRSIWHKQWVTSGTSRPVLITDLEEAYRKEELIETYRDAEGEARNMIYGKTNKPEHPPGKHDDRVFSRGIALQMMKGPKPTMEFLD